MMVTVFLLTDKHRVSREAPLGVRSHERWVCTPEDLLQTVSRHFETLGR